MPFILPTNRHRIDKEGPKACTDVGDICYVFYKHFVFAWNLEPRWRTAHRLYRDSIKDRCECSFYALVCTELAQKFSLDDIDTALSLAWQVFFQKFIYKYELEKIEQNGDIL